MSTKAQRDRNKVLVPAGAVAFVAAIIGIVWLVAGHPDASF